MAEIPPIDGPLPIYWDGRERCWRHADTGEVLSVEFDDRGFLIDYDKSTPSVSYWDAETQSWR